MRTLSIIIPVFNEEENLDVLHLRLHAVLSCLHDIEAQIVFIDDHSTDNTPKILKSLQIRDSRVRWYRLSRNSGAQTACIAGIDQCRQSDAIVIMAADLQDPPELLPNLIAKHNQGAQLVWAIRDRRDGESWITRKASEFFYWLMNRLTGIKSAPKGAIVFLADRQVVDAFCQVSERAISLFAMFSWLGFRQDSINYVAPPRHAGVSKWTISRKVLLAIDSFVGFSYLPLRFMSAVGIAVSAIGGFWAIYVLAMRLAGHTQTEGYASIIITMLVLGGLQMLMLGVLGEYHWRTLEEARRRPRYFVESTSAVKPAPQPGELSTPLPSPSDEPRLRI